MPRSVPADFEDALASSPAARERFWALPPEQKDAWVAYVERARFPGARRRRVGDAARRLGVVDETAVVASPMPRETWPLWLLALAAVAGLAALLLWLTVFRDDGRKPGAVVVPAASTVPSVTGIRVQAAQFQLREAKLGSVLTRRTAQKPKGIVLAQSPQAGKSVRQGTSVRLVVSNGPPRVALPDLTGLAAADAVQALRDRKLRPRLQQVAAGGAAGTVVAQSPKAGARLKVGATVTLQVVRAKPSQPAPTTPPTTTTPTTTTQRTTTSSPPAHGNDYTGMRLTDAVQKIAQGRQQVIVAYVSSSDPAGLVVSNRPDGTRELLQVSRGPHPQPAARVPPVEGADAATAEQDLRGAGFAVIEVQWPVSDESKDGLVLRQTPAAGTAIPRGSAVVIYVGSAGSG